MLRYLQVSHSLGLTRSYNIQEHCYVSKHVRVTCVPIQAFLSATIIIMHRRRKTPKVRRSKLDAQSPQYELKRRCRELGLFIYGDKEALWTRIVNEENRLSADSQVKDNDTDQEILCSINDFERCPELKRWYKNHAGEPPCRQSGDHKEATLATWLDKARSRRYRTHDESSSGRMLTAAETIHLNDIMESQRSGGRHPNSSSSTQPQVLQGDTIVSASSIENSVADLNPGSQGSEPPEDSNSFDFFKRCNELSLWFMHHPGKRPCRRTDNSKERSLAIWLERALLRREAAWSDRPCMRQLTTEETAHLNSIMGASLSPTTYTSITDTTKRMRNKAHVSDTNPKRIRTQTLPYSNSKAVTLCLRGLNIQWPFSQLLLMGAKLVEVSDCPLDLKDAPMMDEQVWIVETRGDCIKSHTNAIVNNIPITHRPSAAQIVGTISFNSSQTYYYKHDFDKDRERHRIKRESKLDWDGNSTKHGWHVGSVQQIDKPISIGSTGKKGIFFREKFKKTSTDEASFSVEFATAAAQHSYSANAPAVEDNTGHPEIGSSRGCPDGPMSDRAPSIFGHSTSYSHTNEANSLCSTAHDPEPKIPFYQLQDRGWCGMHALNNYLGGDYVTHDTCRRACSQVVAALSQPAGGRIEDSSQHLDQESGWLSIDVINIIGQSRFDFHVEGFHTDLDLWAKLDEGAALVNWNNKHWTVLLSRSSQGPWIHINSVFHGSTSTESLYGRVETHEMSEISAILDDIRKLYGGVSVHRIVKTSKPLPPEDVLPTDAAESNAMSLSDEELSDTNITQEISLVTINVLGIATYYTFYFS